MIKLTEELIASLNKSLIEMYSPGEMIGIKEDGLLNSAVNRPFQTMFGKSLYPDIFEKAVALFESLAKNHVFFNANKRTAFMSMTYFLFINGHNCMMSDKEAADMTVDFVTGNLTFEDTVALVRKRSYWISRNPIR